MDTIKKLIKKYFVHLSYFYAQLRYRLFLTVVFSFLVGIFDSIGLTMFIPLIELVGQESETTSTTLGNLTFLIEFLQSLGISLTLQSVLLVMLTMFIFKGIATFFEYYYKIIVQQYFMKKLRLNNISLLSGYEFEQFVVADAGRIQNTLSAESERVVTAFGTYFKSIQSTIMLLVYVGIAYFANPQFALMVTVGGVVSNFSFRYIYKKTVKISRKVTADSHIYQGLLLQKVNFYKYLKATGLTERFSVKLKTVIEKIERSNRKAGFLTSILVAIREPMVMLIVVSVIIIQVVYLGHPIGPILLSLALFYRALTYVLNLQTEWNKFLNVSGSMENMTDFQKNLKENQELLGDEKFEKFESDISLQNVSFSYGKTTILRNLSLDIPKNKTVAFVGESGSGKTTLVNLIAGLMKAKEGQVLIDGRNITDLDVHTYQSRIGYITQEPVIFNDTIFNNVTFWAPKTPENLRRFWESLEKASIDEYVKELEGNEEELLGNNGINLSGGQKQRISIARELFKEIDILVMDEATSALDSETEKAIQENIDALKGRYTILIVAHRLSTIKSADKLILLKKGEIDQMGSYSELMANSESFQRMVRLQEV